MKKILLLLTLFFCSSAIAEELPSYTGRLTDKAEVVSMVDRGKILDAISRVEGSSSKSNQIAVLIVKNFPEGYDVDKYASEVFRKWGVGHKGLDNGILLVIATEARKIRIEVGYGLEGSYPDAAAARTIDKMKPLLTKGKERWAEAILVAIEDFSKNLEKPAQASKTSGGKYSIFGFVLFLGVLGFVAYLLFFRKTEADKYFEKENNDMKWFEDKMKKRYEQKKSETSELSSFVSGALTSSVLSSTLSSSSSPSSRSSSSSSSDSSSSSFSDLFSFGGGDSGGGGSSSDF